MKAIKQKKSKREQAKVEKEKFLVEISTEEKEELILCLMVSGLRSLKYKKYKECETDEFGETYGIDDIRTLLSPKETIITVNRVRPITVPVPKPKLPIRIKALFRNNRAKKSKLPTGVHYDKTHNVYGVNCNICSVKKKVGTFRDPESAFIAYKAAKESEVKRIVQFHYDNGDIDQSMYDELMRWEVKR